MATDLYVTLIDYELGDTCSDSIQSFMIKNGDDPAISLGLCANFVKNNFPPRSVKLRVLAHGLEYSSVFVQEGDKQRVIVGLGGYGLRMGGVQHGQAVWKLFQKAPNIFEEIVFAACGLAADFGPVIDGQFTGDGPTLCRNIAKATNTPVWASDREQEVLSNKITLAKRQPNPPGVPVILTPWVGNVYRFPADGGEGQLMIKSTLPSVMHLRRTPKYKFPS